MAPEEIEKARKAASICYSNGLVKCYGLAEMAHYMFAQGIIYAKTGKMPEDLFEDTYKNEKDGQENNE